MRRIHVLAIVLTLAIGPTTSILCHGWCAGNNPAQECHETLAAVVAAGCCIGPATSLTAVMGSESRQETVTPALEAGGSHRLVEEPVTSAGLIRRHQPHGSHPNSLVTVLRI